MASAVDRLFGGDTVLCDGAMGTMLYSCGVFINRCYDELNLSQPEVVRGMVANGLGYSILNFPLKLLRTVDGANFVIKQFKEDVTATTLGIAQSRELKPRQLVKRFAEFCETHIRELHRNV